MLIRSRRVVTPIGVMPACVEVEEGRIVRVRGWDDVASELSLHDVGDFVLMPGLVDSHVHVNEPGRTHWEGFETATRAALAGGVTTLLDMPLNSIPATTTVAALDRKRNSARGRVSVDVAFIGGVVPGNAGELAALRHAGVLAFKCFLVPSGVEEFPAVSERDLEQAFPVLASLGLPLMVHAEHPDALVAPSPGSRGSYPDYLASRPPEAECAAIEMIVRLMERWPVRAHIVHLTSRAGLDVVRSAQSRGLPLSAETCPHYLTFAANEVPENATEYKCAPPIRDAAEREALWDGLRDGSISQVVTDHSPAPPEMKASGGNFFEAWGGIASLQLSLPATWSAAHARGIGIDHVVEWMCRAPAALVGLDARKGSIAAGRDADLVVFDPEGTFTVDPARLFHRHPLTPYAGRLLHGVVREVWRRGQRACADGSPMDHGGVLLPGG